MFQFHLHDLPMEQPPPATGPFLFLETLSISFTEYSQTISTHVGLPWQH
jgi:hypothetical protein